MIEPQEEFKPSPSRQYTVTQIIDENGTREIDNKSVEMFMDRLESDCSGKTKSNHIAYLQEIKSMDERQLHNLASQLVAETLRYARLWNSSFSKNHQASVESMRELREMAKRSGIDLWPELE